MGDVTDLSPKESSPVSTASISRKLKLDEFIKLPPPPSTHAKKKPGEARVLTSDEFLLELDKKEEEKKKQVELKEQRKQVRLEKAAARAAGKVSKGSRAAGTHKSGLWPKKVTTSGASKLH